MPKVSRDQLAARQQEILDRARSCFARYGYEGATVRRLEETTGRSRGAIFHHFADKDALFLAIAEQESRQMADVVAEQGLVQVMRELLDHPERQDWMGTRLEVARRRRTDPAFAARWAQRSAGLTAATRERLHRRRAEGTLRDDVDPTVLVAYLELVLDGLIAALAAGSSSSSLSPVLDLVEDSVRRH